MVEFALGAVALFSVLFALMTFGYTFGKQLDLKGATRDAARRGAVSAELSNARTITEQTLRDQLTLTNDNQVTITVTPAPPWNHGDLISVRSSTPHEFSIMGVTAWSGTLRAESEIRVE